MGRSEMMTSNSEQVVNGSVAAEKAFRPQHAPQDRQKALLECKK